jgi:phenylacetate-CoA ligase
LYREAMPLLRYDIGDEVEVRYADCACGWVLPTVRVLGRSGVAYPVGGAPVTQAALEELVFGLPARYGVMFWRAQADPDRLRVELEVPAAFLERVHDQLRAAIHHRLGIRAEVTCVAPGSLVPQRVLTTQPDIVKPRSLFGPGEDWDAALLYC